MERNCGVDCFKYFFAMCVVFMHSFHNPDTLLLWDGTLKLAVPFFFVCSGFFIREDLLNSRNTAKRLRYYILLYFFWMAIYSYSFISNLEFIHEEGSLFLKVVKVLYIFLFAEGYFHLWYLIAIIYGIVFTHVVFYFTPPTHHWMIYGFALTVYLYGLLGDSYAFLDQCNLFYPIKLLWGNTRNCLTYAFPFITLGVLISKTSNKNVSSLEVIGFVASLIAYFMELSLVKGHSHQSFLFVSTPIVLFFLFRFSFAMGQSLTIWQPLKKLVTTSDFVYFIHPLAVSAVFANVAPEHFVMRLLILYSAIIIISVLVHPFYKALYNRYCSGIGFLQSKLVNILGRYENEGTK